MKLLIITTILCLLPGCSGFREVYEEVDYYRKNGVQLTNDYKLDFEGSTAIIHKYQGVSYGYDYKKEIFLVNYKKEF